MALGSDNSDLDAYSGPYNSREMPKLKDEYSSSESETRAFNARSGEQRNGSTREGSARRFQLHVIPNRALEKVIFAREAFV